MRGEAERADGDGRRGATDGDVGRMRSCNRAHVALLFLVRELGYLGPGLAEVPILVNPS
jgi:hypothetical protein